jgi:class 3 adenylate cyclase/predicted ATPase
LSAEETVADVADGERKTVTALFADIKGSTELMRGLDPEEVRAIIDPVLQLMINAVHRYNGYVVQSAGDGIFALFGAPIAHEDHPQRAVHAAIAMREALAAVHNERRDRPKIEVRIGINTGEVVLRTMQIGGHTEYTPVGYTANLAARMQSAAPSDAIVISENTQHLVGGYFELRELGVTQVKGVDQPINLYQVLDVTRVHGHFDLAVQRGLTRFVGREREIAELNRALELALVGRGQIIAVVAEPGTGKSRLFHEFKAKLPPTCKLLEAYSVSHGRASAWLPVLELLYGYYGLLDTEAAVARREKIRSLLAALDTSLADALPYLWNLLSISEEPDPLAQMDAQIKRQRTLESLKRIVLRESLRQPVVIIFEDLHWIDSETQALLDLIADSITNAPVLMVVNYRPEYRNGWASKSVYTQLRLDPLELDEAEAMLAALIGESDELSQLKRTVIERAGGNPFFIEEIVRALFDEGALTRNGVVRLTRPLAQLRLPPTVQSMLASRIDRLAPAEKNLLQTLAAIGRQAPRDLVKKVTPGVESGLDLMLSSLCSAEFIYERPGRHTEYVFKHALTQQAAYESLLIDRRKRIHERVGEAIEEVFSGQIESHVDELAYHFRCSENFKKAIHYLNLAGTLAVKRSAYTVAIAQFTLARELTRELVDETERLKQELEILINLGPALIATEGFASGHVEQTYTRARQLASIVGARQELFWVLRGLWEFNVLRGRLTAAHDIARQLLDLATDLNDPLIILEATCAMGHTQAFTGDIASARDHLERGIALYNRIRPSVPYFYIWNPGVVCLIRSAHALSIMGFAQQAEDRCILALRAAEETSHPFTLACVTACSAWIYQHRHDYHLTQEWAEAGLRLSAENGFPFWQGMSKVLRGWAMGRRGNFDEGVSEIHAGINEWRATGTETLNTYWLALLAEVYIETGQTEEGLGVLSESLRSVSGSGEKWREAELHRLKGTLLLMAKPDRKIEAEENFVEAIRVAKGQGAKLFELRASTSLARLLRDTGRRDEARTMLAEMYNWFTEGFDTADLKDAKALLDELTV